MRFKFDGWPWNIIGHYFFTTSSFVHHFKSISEFKLEWHSGNAQFGWKSAIFVPCDLEILRMTLKNNRAPILCCFKLGHHFIAINEFKLKIQSGNAQFRSKSKIFFSRVTLKFDGWPWKTMGHITYATSSFVHRLFYPLVNSNSSYGPETPNLGKKRLF